MAFQLARDGLSSSAATIHWGCQDGPCDSQTTILICQPLPYIFLLINIHCESFSFTIRIKDLSILSLHLLLQWDFLLYLISLTLPQAEKAQPLAIHPKWTENLELTSATMCSLLLDGLLTALRLLLLSKMQFLTRLVGIVGIHLEQ